MSSRRGSNPPRRRPAIPMPASRPDRRRHSTASRPNRQTSVAHHLEGSKASCGARFQFNTQTQNTISFALWAGILEVRKKHRTFHRKDFALFHSAASPLAHDSAPFQKPKTLRPPTRDTPRRLNRSAKLRRFNLPKILQAHQAHKPRPSPRRSWFLRHTAKPGSCSAARTPQRSGEAVSQPQDWLSCAHCRAG